MLDLEEVVARVTALRLPAGHFALHGSAPLLAHGLVEAVGDVDIVARGPAWRRALALGLPGRGSRDRVVQLPGGVEVFDGWLGDDADELIDGAEAIRGLPCVRLERVLAFKRRLGRPKDARHIALLEAHLRGR